VPAALFPQRIVPMQRELAPEPFHRLGWVYEEEHRRTASKALGLTILPSLLAHADQVIE
jgi:hypothetical protein